MSEQSKKLTMKDKAIISAIKLEIMEGGSIDTFTNILCKDLSRNSRYQYKKRFMYLYDTYLVVDDEVAKKLEFDETLHQLLNMSKFEGEGNVWKIH